MLPKDTNDKGEYALWDKGNLIGYAKMEMVDGRMVKADHKQKILDMKADAAKDNILLTLNSGFRTYSKQLELRRTYRKNFEDALTKAGKKFESKLKDENFMLTAGASEFSPKIAKPGWSNHQDGSAYDFMVRDDPNTPQNEALAFGWLVKNAITYGFIRTVDSERWHWELRPGAGQYSIVPETHTSWKL